MPCGARPDKPYISCPTHRLEMIRRAVKDFFPSNFPLKVDPIEVENGPSIPTAYLFDTLHEKYPDTQFYFIMGSDLVPSLHWWDDGARIIKEMKMIVFRRKGYDNEAIMANQNFP